MINELNKISPHSKMKKSKKLFVNAVVTFNQSLFINIQQQVIDRILEVYLHLPGINNAAMFILDENSYEFHLCNVVGTMNGDKTVELDKYFRQIFDESIEKGLIAQTLDLGHLVKAKYNESVVLFLMPVVSPAGVLGMVLLTADKLLKEYSNQIQNYIFLHASQISYQLFNSKLNKKINILEDELEQKISIRIEKIKQSRRELLLILDSILTGVFIIEKKTGNIIDVNYAALKLIGVDRDKVIGTNWQQWHLNEKNKTQKITAFEEQFAEETILIDCNNKKIPILRNFSNLLIGNKNVYLESFIDITERKEKEEQLKSQSNLLKGATEASNSLLTQMNFNEAVYNAIEFLGKAANVDRVYIYENKINENLNELVADIKYFWAKTNVLELKRLPKNFYYKNNFKRWKEILETKGAFHGIVNKLDGDIKNRLSLLGIKSILIVPIIIENKFWGFIGFDDCTDEREWTEIEESILKVTANSIGGAIQRYMSKLQLIKAKEKVDMSDKLKSEFLAQISHEIRTPINSILSFSSILKDEFEEQLSEDLKSTFEVITNAGNRITRTVELILNISEMNTGIYDYKPVEINFCSEVIVPIFNEFLRFAKSKNIELSISNNCKDLIIIADKYSVIQIFSNLVDNAVKFTEKGKVCINLIKNEEGNLIVEINDTGIGISSNYINEIYSVFSQEDHGYTRRYEGNGLGLALVKKYCDLNNFELKIESQKDIGSKFIVTIPAK